MMVGMLISPPFRNMVNEMIHGPGFYEFIDSNCKRILSIYSLDKFAPLYSSNNAAIF